MKKNGKSCYIIYEYDSFKNDYKYISEYLNKEDIIKDYQLKNKKSIYHYIKESIDSNITKLLKDKYIIIKESL